MAIIDSGGSGLSEVIAMFVAMGFRQVGTNTVTWGDDDSGNVLIELNPESNTARLISSDDYKDSWVTSGNSGYAMKAEYFTLKNGGIVLKAIWTNAPATAVVDKCFQFCALKQADDTYKYIYRSYRDSHYYVWYDDNNGVITRLRPYAGTLATPTVNVCQIAEIFDQHSDFIGGDAKLLTLCPNTLLYQTTYEFMVDGETYVTGMSETDNSSSGAVGSRLCFRTGV